MDDVPEDHAMNALDGLLQGIVDDPLAEDRWLILADWLEEHDDPRKAELLRLHRHLLATCCQPDRHPERCTWQARIVDLLGQGVRPCLPQRTISLGDGVEMTFNFIPPGTFLMGSPEDEAGWEDNEPAHRVELTRGFWLSGHPLTQVQWRVVMGSCPNEATTNAYPISNLSWADCLTFCKQSSERTGWQHRLPTEAEWEWACRAGTTTAYYTGDGVEAMKRAGWCNDDGTWGTGKQTLPGYLDYGKGAAPKPVGQFDPNAWGMHDMHGNVWEWCQDCYERHCRLDEERVDPIGPAKGTKRVLRGGSYFNDPVRCRSAARVGFEPDMPADAVGCRLCLCLD